VRAMWRSILFEVSSSVRRGSGRGREGELGSRRANVALVLLSKDASKQLNFSALQLLGTTSSTSFSNSVTSS